MIADLAWLSLPAGAALGFLAGLALGILHFVSLGKVTGLYLAGGSALRAIGLQLSRFAPLVATLALLAHAGAVPLLAGAAGLLAGRAIVLGRGPRRS